MRPYLWIRKKISVVFVLPSNDTVKKGYGLIFAGDCNEEEENEIILRIWVQKCK